MFQKILVTPKKSLSIRQDIIDLVDLMLYFDEVHMIVPYGMFYNLFNAFSENLLVHLLKSKRLFLHPTDSTLACNTTGTGVYGLTFVSHGWDDIHQLLYNFHRRIFVNNSIQNLRFADKFAPLLSTFEYSRDIGIGIYDDLRNPDYLIKITELYLSIHFPEYVQKDKLRIDIELIESDSFPDAFKIHSNIDVNQLTAIRACKGKKESFDYYPLLLDLANARTKSYLAVQFESELISTSDNAEYLKLLINENLRKANQSINNINAFQKHVLFDSISIGEAYVEKVISEEELISVLTDAEQFRNWLSNIPTDSDLIAEYIKEISKKTLADNPLLKWGRALICNLFGFIPGIGSVIGTGLSVLDMLYGDKILSGWRPNIFVDDLKETINRKR